MLPSPPPSCLDHHLVYAVSLVIGPRGRIATPRMRRKRNWLCYFVCIEGWSLAQVSACGVIRRRIDFLMYCLYSEESCKNLIIDK